MNINNFFSSEIKENALNKINIINFIDVALVLVIILLMVSPMIEQGIEVKLPVSGPSRIGVEKSIVITITKDGKLFWGNLHVTINELIVMAQNTVSKNPEIGIVIKGDKNITYQELINVLDILKRADIKRIGLATQISQ
ncbi:MAG: biopolymer transporter ExbD [Candidatus Omnitrophica bacterium]|nr:biopolymer transporter ExbD [Candidatus Omnitrophota bacterium]